MRGALPRLVARPDGKVPDHVQRVVRALALQGEQGRSGFKRLFKAAAQSRRVRHKLIRRRSRLHGLVGGRRVAGEADLIIFEDNLVTLANNTAGKKSQHKI